MIERTFDYRIVKRITGINPVISSKYIYLIDGDYLWYLKPFKDGLLLSRCDATPCKGKEGKRSGKEVFTWVFENTDCKIIYGQIDKTNKPARYMASLVGMKKLFTEDNYIFYGITHEQIQSEISKHT